MTIPEIDKDFLRERQLPEFSGQTADYHNEKIGKIAYKEFFRLLRQLRPARRQKQYAAPALQRRTHHCGKAGLHSQDDPQV